MKFSDRALSMHKQALSGAAAALAALLASSTALAAPVTVVVTNFQSDVGEVNLAVYDNDDDFLGENTFTRAKLDVSDNLVEGNVTFTLDLEPGEYAITIHHDDNDNGKMDTNFMGIPKEPAAFSNGHVPRFGPPKYKKAAFTIGEDGTTMTIDLPD